MTEEQEKQPEVAATTEEPTPSESAPAATTPTAEERLQALQADHDKTQQSLKSLQGILRQKDLTIKQQSDVNSRIEAMNERIELLATAIASRGSEEDVASLPKEERNKVLEQIKQMKQAEKERHQTEVAAQKGLEFKARVEAAGLTENDEAYWEIEDLVSRGKLSYAETKLKKIEQAKEKVVTEKSTKTVEQQAKELAEQMYQERLKREGLLKTDTLKPSGGKGRTPTLEELKASAPEETEKKVKSGEWKLPGWVS